MTYHTPTKATLQSVNWNSSSRDAARITEAIALAAGYQTPVSEQKSSATSLPSSRQVPGDKNYRAKLTEAAGKRQRTPATSAGESSGSTTLQKLCRALRRAFLPLLHIPGLTLPARLHGTHHKRNTGKSHRHRNPSQV